MKKFVKFVTFVVVLVLTFTACQKEKESEILLQKENSYFDTHKYRGVFSKEDLRKVRKASNVSNGAGNQNIPLSFDLTSQMPPMHSVGQGYNGACLSWAASSVVSYLQHKKNNTPYTEETIMSPSYLFSQLRKFDEYGNEISDYIPTFDMLKAEGICTIAQKPSNEYDIRPNDYQREQAKKNRIRNYERISFSQIKEKISKGIPVIVAFYLSGGAEGTFREPFVDAQNRRIWNRNDNQESYAHATVIVGYDQEYFYLYNSWGTYDRQGVHNGLVYVTYDTLEEALQRYYGVESLFILYGDENIPTIPQPYTPRPQPKPYIPEPQPAPTPEPREERISVNSNYLNFSELELNQQSTEYLSIRNEGNREAYLRFRIEGYSFRLQEYSRNLSQGESFELPIIFAPTQEGRLSGTLIISSSNDEKRISLSGYGKERREYYQVQSEYVSYLPTGTCGIPNETIQGKIEASTSIVEEDGNRLRITLILRKTDNSSFRRGGRFYVKLREFCAMPMDRAGKYYYSGANEITQTITLNKSEVDYQGLRIYLLTIADGGTNERNYCAIRITKN